MVPPTHSECHFQYVPLAARQSETERDGAVVPLQATRLLCLDLVHILHLVASHLTNKLLHKNLVPASLELVHQLCAVCRIIVRQIRSIRKHSCHLCEMKTNFRRDAHFFELRADIFKKHGLISNSNQVLSTLVGVATLHAA